MIKIKLLEHEIHRNETTFRPFVFAQNTLREVGIEFTNSDDYDYAWVGQASIIDKKKSFAIKVSALLHMISPGALYSFIISWLGSMPIK